MMRVRKNDTVAVIAGKDKGKRGKVLVVDPHGQRVMVHGVAVVGRHTKARRSGETPGIRKKESYISISKVMPVCTSCDRPVRVNVKVEKQTKMRICNRCQGAL